MSDKFLPENLLTSLYTAATQRAAWSTFCDHLSHSLNAPVLMFGHSCQSHDSLGLVGGNIDPVHLQSYRDHYGSLNPWMPMNFRVKPGFIGVSDWALPRHDLIRTEFYNDWLRHQNDAIAGPAMICHRSTRKFVSIAASAKAAVVDTDLSKMVELMRALSPHILRCVDISSTLSSSNGAMPSHLNASRHAIAFIHRSGRAGFVNDAATDLMETTGLLSILPNGALGSSDPNVNDQMARAINSISNEAICDLPAPLTLDVGSHVPLTFHSHIFPESDQQDFPESIWSDPVAGAIVVTGYRGLSDDDSAEEVANSFGATPAEAKLAGALIRGQSLYEFADQHSLSRHTVRNQMRALLAKSGSRDQIEFVRKIHQRISPFKTIRRVEH